MSVRPVPDLSHYVGRKIEQIIGLDDGRWAVKLTGDIWIHNEDGSLPRPDERFIGMQFLLLSIHKNVTTMHIGRTTAVEGGYSSQEEGVINFKPMSYQISDRDYGGPVYPQVSEAQADKWQPPVELPGYPGDRIPPERPAVSNAEDEDGT